MNDYGTEQSGTLGTAITPAGSWPGGLDFSFNGSRDQELAQLNKATEERAQVNAQRAALNLQRHMTAQQARLAQEEARLGAARLEAAERLAALERQLNHEYAVAEHELMQAMTRVENPYVSPIAAPAATTAAPARVSPQEARGMAQGLMRLMPPQVR
jgi:hypothetical protein